MALDLGLDQLDIKDTPPKDRASAPRRGRDTNKRLREGLEGIYSLGGIVLSLKCQVCAQIVLESATQRANEWIHLAEQNPAVKRALETLVSGSVWGEVVIGNIAMVMPILVHHQILPATFLQAFQAPEEHTHEHVEQPSSNGFVPEGVVTVGANQ